LSDAKYWYDHRKDELSFKDRQLIEFSVAVQDGEVKQRRRRREIIFSGLLTRLLAALTLAGVAWRAWHTSAMNKIRALSISSDALLSSHQPFDALLEALKAKKQAQRQIFANVDMKF
jgi:hypothetical protein